MKEKQTQMWIPLYVDKWIFGSTRIELDPAERSVFIDLLAFGAKDKGYIRANETTAYHHAQLAGLLNIPIGLLESTIAKCLHFEKLIEPTPGIYRLKNWDEYQLSKSYISLLESGKRHIPGTSLSTESLQVSTKGLPIREDKREEEIIEDNTTTFGDFSIFWKAYPRKTGKDAALKAWIKKAPPLNICLKSLEWQKNQPQWTKDGGQFIPHASTWINGGRWLDEPLRASASHKGDYSAPIPGKYDNLVIDRGSDGKI